MAKTTEKSNRSGQVRRRLHSRPFKFEANQGISLRKSNKSTANQI